MSEGGGGGEEREWRGKREEGGKSDGRFEEVEIARKCPKIRVLLVFE